MMSRFFTAAAALPIATKPRHFPQKIAELLPNARRIVVELTGVEVIDSAGLGELVVVHMWIRASGCSLKLAGANPRVQQLLELTNLMSVFDVHPTLDDALLSFRGKIANPNCVSRRLGGG